MTVSCFVLAVNHVNGDTARIYIDENPEPKIVGISTESNSDNYIKIGDGSGDAIGGYLDWCILDLSGAYAPGEGLEAHHFYKRALPQ